MRDFIVFLTAVLILAIAQALYAALVVALLIVAVMGAATFPRQTFGLVAALGLLALALRAPAACAAALGAVGVAFLVIGQIGRRMQRKAVVPQTAKVLMIEGPKPIHTD